MSLEKQKKEGREESPERKTTELWGKPPTSDSMIEQKGRGEINWYYASMVNQRKEKGEGSMFLAGGTLTYLLGL